MQSISVWLLSAGGRVGWRYLMSSVPIFAAYVVGATVACSESGCLSQYFKANRQSRLFYPARGNHQVGVPRFYANPHIASWGAISSPYILPCSRWMEAPPKSSSHGAVVFGMASGSLEHERDLQQCENLGLALPVHLDAAYLPPSPRPCLKRTRLPD